MKRDKDGLNLVIVLKRKKKFYCSIFGLMNRIDFRERKVEILLKKGQRTFCNFLMALRIFFFLIMPIKKN